jgi:hypothetical protein
MNDGAGDDGDELSEARHPLHGRQVGGEGRRVQHNIADTLNAQPVSYIINLRGDGIAKVFSVP